MSGNTNLQEVLASMKVSCDEVEYGFATVPAGSHIAVEDILGIMMFNLIKSSLAAMSFFERLFKGL